MIRTPGSPLAHFIDACRRLSVEELSAQVAPAFIVVHVVEMRAPAGPGITRNVPARPAPADDFQETTGDIDLRAMAVVRRPGSDFPFVSIGRVADNDVVVDDASISKFHAYIKLERDGFLIQDGKSRNGTFVGDLPVAVRGVGPPSPLPSGVALRFGAVTTTFMSALAFRNFVVQTLGGPPRP